uniref:Ig-like domain-containing protein n=1 Tax=Nothobranchius furzeri TaxID=105023 RepID=A0A8C6LHX7_NOTFU
MAVGNVTVDLGGTVELECKVDSHEVTWVLPSQVQMIAGQANGHVQQRVRVNDNGTLWISQASLTDTGTYRCTGNRVAGSDAVSVRLHVSARPPEIQQRKHENMTLMEGSFAYITCTATGIPQPIIHWTTPDGLKLSSSQTISGQNLIVFPNGTLHIQRLSPRNSGRYECLARNTISSSHRTVMLSKNQLPVRVFHGQTVTLQCNAKGDPIPTITWMSPTNRLILPSLDKYQILKDGTLVVQKVQRYDGGNYTCIARNSVGQDHKVARLEILITPPVFSDQRGAARSVTLLFYLSGVPNPPKTQVTVNLFI